MLSNFSTADAFSNESSFQPLISAATAHVIETTVQVGVLPVVVVTGATLNVINMAVFVRQGLTDRINLCLFSVHVFARFFENTQPNGFKFGVKSLSVVGVYAGFLNTSNILTMIISLERCMCVLSPLRARRLLSRRYMAAIILLVYTVCLSGCGLVIFMYDTVRYRDPLTNTSHYRPVPSKYYLRNQVALDVIFDVKTQTEL
nr:hypothetical protein BaRGS_032247 [Batillaria attramentaria]